jgi:hypothetical protein
MKPKIPRVDNFEEGDVGLWIDVQAYVSGRLVHHVCPYDKCKNFNDAEKYYYKNFYNERTHTPIKIIHHKLSKKQIYQMSLAC